MKSTHFIALWTVVSLSSAVSIARAHLAPNLDRFLQRDPKPYADEFHLYQYERSAPVAVGDPGGLIPNCTRTLPLDFLGDPFNGAVHPPLDILCTTGTTGLKLPSVSQPLGYCKANFNDATTQCWCKAMTLCMRWTIWRCNGTAWLPTSSGDDCPP